MAIGFAAKCAKFLLFVFNILVFLAGVALFAVGIWLLVDENTQRYFDVIDDNGSEGTLRAACIAVIFVGAVAAVISFCGCCGACKENNFLLMTYAVVLGVILVIQVAAGITAAVFRSEIGDGLADSMNKTVQEKYGMKGYSDLTDTWDFMQVEFNCCGTKSSKDWQTSEWAKNSSHPVPVTCCVLRNDNPSKPKPVDEQRCYSDAQAGSSSSRYLHVQGCEDSLHDWIQANADIIIGVAFGMAVILLLGLICACVLRSNKNGGYQYV